MPPLVYVRAIWASQWHVGAVAKKTLSQIGAKKSCVIGNSRNPHVATTGAKRTRWEQWGDFVTAAATINIVHFSRKARIAKHLTATDSVGLEHIVRLRFVT